MKKTILKFGLISGLISALLMSISVSFIEKLCGSSLGYLWGYTSMVLSFLLVYFGIRSYRDNVAGGHITFGKGFAIGISITLITCICYVVTWEIIYFNFLPNFMDIYGNKVIDQLKASGASAAAIQEQAQKMDKLKLMYKNPLINSAMTFIEPLPVGLVMTLVSAAILRKKSRSELDSGALATAS